MRRAHALHGDPITAADRDRADAYRARWISWKIQKQMIPQYQSDWSTIPAANEVIAQMGKTEK
jgi:hypothetical protein